MQSFARPFVGFFVLAGVASPFIFSSRSTPPVAVTDPINEMHGKAMLAYKAAAATPVQDAWPQAVQRGVQLDGMMRSGAHQQMVIAGNPFENAWRAPSIGGVRLDTGTFALQEVDIALPAEGFSWVIGRSYNARQDDGSHRDSDGYQGKNWFQTSQPEILLYDDPSAEKDDMVYLVYGADRYAEYLRVASGGVTFKGTNGAAGIIEFTDGGAGPDTYQLTDQNGNELTFFGFDSDAGAAAGQLWTIEDPDGNKAYVGDATTASTAISNGFDSSGRILYAYDTSDRRYTYTYTTLDSVDRLTQVKAETKTGGTWASPTGLATVARVDYAYYTSETYGDPGDLKTVQLTTPMTDSGVDLKQTKYFRYWEGTYDADTNPGHPHALQYVVDYEGVRQFDWSDSLFDGDHLTASESSLSPYATAYFEYDSGHRIKEAWFNGECGCSGANNGTHEFEYEANGSYSDTTDTYDTTWCTRTVVKRPDLTYLTQYWDEAGQPLSQVITDADPDNTSPVPSRWVTSVTRDSNGLVSSVATPTNCTGYTHSTGAITASTSAGLVWEYTRETGTVPSKGYVTALKYKEGSSGTAYYDKEWAYTDSSLVRQSGQTGETHVIRPTLDKGYSYQVKDSTTASRITTGYTPPVHSGELALSKNQADEPAIATGNNGSGTANSSKPHYRLDGTPSFEVAPDGVVTYREYTDGRLAKQIDDADTDETSDFDVSVPSGVSSSSGWHRVTTYAYDAQGRLDSVTHPDGRVAKHY